MIKLILHFTLILSLIYTSSVFAQTSEVAEDIKIESFKSYDDVAVKYGHPDLNAFIKKEKLSGLPLPEIHYTNGKFLFFLQKTKGEISFSQNRIKLVFAKKEMSFLPFSTPEEMKKKIEKEMSTAEISLFNFFIPQAEASPLLGAAIMAAIIVIVSLTYGLITESRLRSHGRDGREACSELRANPHAVDQADEITKIYNDLAAAYLSHCVVDMWPWYKEACTLAANSKSCLRAHMDKTLTVNNSQRSRKSNYKYDEKNDQYAPIKTKEK